MPAVGAIPADHRTLAAGDVLIAGERFGAGASREQAALALRYRGVRAVIAASFSEIYRRNAFNCALPLLEAPELVAALRRAPVRRRGELSAVGELLLDFGAWRATWNGAVFPVGPISEYLQAVAAGGGLGALVRARLAPGGIVTT